MTHPCPRLELKICSDWVIWFVLLCIWLYGPTYRNKLVLFLLSECFSFIEMSRWSLYFPFYMVNVRLEGIEPKCKVVIFDLNFIFLKVFVTPWNHKIHRCSIAQCLKGIFALNITFLKVFVIYWNVIEIDNGLRLTIDWDQQSTEINNWLRSTIDWDQQLTEINNWLRSTINWDQH